MGIEGLTRGIFGPSEEDRVACNRLTGPIVPSGWTRWGIPVGILAAEAYLIPACTPQTVQVTEAPTPTSTPQPTDTLTPTATQTPRPTATLRPLEGRVNDPYVQDILDRAAAGKIVFPLEIPVANTYLELSGIVAAAALAAEQTATAAVTPTLPSTKTPPPTETPIPTDTPKPSTRTPRPSPTPTEPPEDPTATPQPMELPTELSTPTPASSNECGKGVNVPPLPPGGLSIEQMEVTMDYNSWYMKAYLPPSIPPESRWLIATGKILEWRKERDQLLVTINVHKTDPTQTATFTFTPRPDRPLEFIPAWLLRGRLDAPRVYEASDVCSALAAMNAYFQPGDFIKGGWSIEGEPVMGSKVDFYYQRLNIYRGP